MSSRAATDAILGGLVDYPSPAEFTAEKIETRMLQLVDDFRRGRRVQPNNQAAKQDGVRFRR